MDSAQRHEKNVRERIKKARKSRGWSQEKLAREAELSRETIRLIEAGLRTPSLQTQHMLAKAFACSWESLMADNSRGISGRNGDQERRLAVV